MSDRTTRSRWLIVVRHDEPELYQNLREAFAEVADVTVVLDRRRGDRRGDEREGGSGTDRRRIQRREPVSADEEDLWQRAGFRLIHRAEDLQVFESREASGP